MITYSKTVWGLHLLLRFYGSAVPRALLFAGVSAGVTAILHVTSRANWVSGWEHPFVYTTFSSVLGFIIVFRSNFGYSRYWEGRTQLAAMTARWADFATQAIMFDRAAASNAVEPAGHREFVDELCHTLSLLHALALQHLRTDWELDNLVLHREQLPPPSQDAAGSGPAYHFQLLDMFMLRGSPERAADYCRSMPLGVLGKISLSEREGLGRQLEHLVCVKTETLMTGQEVYVNSCFGRLFQLSTGLYVPGASERVQVAFSWVHHLLNCRMKDGGLNMPAPILTRSYQLLSEGFHAFEQARKLCDTPFPFPWAQLVLVLLVLFTFSFPFLIVAYVPSLWMSICLTFITVLCYWALNEVARDLEDPFVYDPNDLPMQRLQYQFNQRLMSMAYNYHACLASNINGGISTNVGLAFQENSSDVESGEDLIGRMVNLHALEMVPGRTSIGSRKSMDTITPPKRRRM